MISYVSVRSVLIGNVVGITTTQLLAHILELDVLTNKIELLSLVHSVMLKITVIVNGAKQSIGRRKNIGSLACNYDHSLHNVSLHENMP
jgi:hypothetical protein